MAIWIWIIAAWVLSFLALGKQKVSFPHLIWILLPVDMYGISVAGATIKPYMIFCMILLVRILLQRNFTLHITKWLAAATVVSGAVVLINLINNTSSSAPKAALLLIIVCGCCCIYLSNCGKERWQEVPNVLVATGIGHGILFIISYILLELGVILPGLSTPTRESFGIFWLNSNYYNDTFIQFYRLRGFTIDPNTTIGVFALCAIVCFLRITNGHGTIKDWCGIVISSICVLLTGSRMGLLCFAILFLLTLIAGYRIASIRVRNYIKLIFLALIFVFLFLLLLTDVVQVIIIKLFETYDNRSGLTDKYGRFSIWIDAINVFLNNNPLLGIGMGQMRYYTATERDCHNTWLSMICENGLIVGSALCLLFFTVTITAITKSKRLLDKHQREFTIGLTLGLLTIMLSLVSVDNVTYSYLWFCAVLLSSVRQMSANEMSHMLEYERNHNYV